LPITISLSPKLLFPLKELVGEAEVRLYDDVKASSADKTIGTGKGES
jgi:hypothetical protein